MAQSEWELFVNRFEKSTRGNYSKALAVGLHHCNSLFADSPTVSVALECYNLIKPMYDLLLSAYIEFLSQSGIQGGTVLSFKQIIDNLPENVDNWQALIKTVYSAKSSAFVALFPKGKSSFNKGTYKQKVNAVSALLTLVSKDVKLAAVKEIIAPFYAIMLLAFDVKDISKKITITDSTAVETARINMCIEMQGNFGLLTTAFKANPSLGAKYFDETLLRNILQMIFAITVKTLATKNIFKRTFAKPLIQKVQVTNNTNTTLQLFLSERKLGKIGLVFVTIEPLSTNIILLTELGDPTKQTYLNIFNADAQIKANLVVKVF